MKKIQIKQILFNNHPVEFKVTQHGEKNKYFCVQNKELNLVSCQATIEMCIKELIKEAKFSKKYYATTEFLEGSIGKTLKELYKKVTIKNKPNKKYEHDKN